ncbi:MAG: SPOR domain-containing protein [Crocinitomicaceae bacterium]|nr:SPOR domain-containing protein [Crocinitomicaceae bacterium]
MFSVKRPLIFLCLFFLFSHIVFSQSQNDSLSHALEKLKRPENTERVNSLGKIEVFSSEAIDSLERYDRGKRETKGFRIQIYLGDFAGAKSTRAKFISSGGELNAYPVQLAPNYAVRVGDFRTLLEAHKYLVGIKKNYPSAFVVEDKIQSPKLVRRKE